MAQPGLQELPELIHVPALTSPITTSCTHMRVQTHPCTSRVACKSWSLISVHREDTTWTLRNDFVKDVKCKLSIPEAQGSSGCWQDRDPEPAPNGEDNRASPHHFPVITGGRPFLVILPSGHPSVCCSLIPAQGATLFPRRLPVMSSGWRGTDGRVGSGQISSLSGMYW